MAKVIDKYFKYKGELSRRDFWKGIGIVLLFMVPLALFIVLLSQTKLSAMSFELFFLIYAALGIWLVGSVLVGRLRRIGRNPYWAIPAIVISYLPFGTILILIIFGAWKHEGDKKHEQTTEQ